MEIHGALFVGVANDSRDSTMGMFVTQENPPDKKIEKRPCFHCTVKPYPDAPIVLVPKSPMKKAAAFGCRGEGMDEVYNSGVEI